MHNNSPFSVQFCRPALILLALVTLGANLVAGRAPAPAGKAWKITLEEPTGIYRRDNEVVTVRVAFQPGEARAEKLAVVDPSGHPITTQVQVGATYPDGSIRTAEILFRANIIPGQRPAFRLVSATPPKGENPMTARRIGIGRLELANERFGVIINLGLEGTEPALVSAFNKSAPAGKMLNLIDTSPDVTESLLYGVRSAGVGTFRAGIDRRGPFAKVDIIEAGPLRVKVRLSSAQFASRSNTESWEFTFLAGSPVLSWKASLDSESQRESYGFFFSCISASPYLPFDRWMEGSEAVKFPDGWEIGNPPDRAIGALKDGSLPGNHIVYYQKKENYGALGIIATDEQLSWHGAGSRQFYSVATASPEKREISLALSFPAWKATETVLEARAEYRKYKQPVLSVIQPDSGESRREVTGISLSFPRTSITRSASPSKTAINLKPTAEPLSLDGQWKLNSAEKSAGEGLGYNRADFDDSRWQTVVVPGTVHTQILSDPEYYSPKANWISQREWWYRKSFAAAPTSTGNRKRLQFEATDYYADIYLNGDLIGRHEGYIDPYDFDVTSKLRSDRENILAVRVWTPVSYYWRHRPYTIKGSYGAVDQKPDDITPLGITRGVRLAENGPAVISDLSTDTRLNADGSADLVVEVAIHSTIKASSELELKLAPRNFQAGEEQNKFLSLRLELIPGYNRTRQVLHLAKPELWWTWDHGKPNLYTLDTRIKLQGLDSDHESDAVGFREIEKLDWKFYLNGKRMFIRGTNSYYNLFLSEMRREKYASDLGLMRGMNINMIRLHCHFSNREFYELCDEMGILIWQDYLEAWYPEDRDFSIKAASLYDQHIRYVRNHPSVALWATSDEESLENYRDLTKHLEPRLYALDPQRRPVVRSTGRYGDGHIYYGWYDGSIWSYASMSERFVSELGATALPNYESLVKFLPKAWPISAHEEEWIFRKLQIPEAMKAWGEPGGKTLKEYIPQTQEYVARLFQLAIERMRRIKYQPSGGILHFHAIDLWPSVTMAAVDYYRQPTLAYNTVRKSFQMVLPSFAYDRDEWTEGEQINSELWLINDHWFDLPGVRVRWELRDDAGRKLLGGDMVKEILKADSSEAFSKLSFKAGKPGRYKLVATVADAAGQQISENDFTFRVRN